MATIKRCDRCGDEIQAGTERTLAWGSYQHTTLFGVQWMKDKEPEWRDYCQGCRSKIDQFAQDEVGR